MIPYDIPSLLFFILVVICLGGFLMLMGMFTGLRLFRLPGDLVVSIGGMRILLPASTIVFFLVFFWFAMRVYVYWLR